LNSNEIYKAIFDAGPDAMLIVDDSGKIIIVNHRTEQLFGYEGNEMIGKEIELLIPERFKREHVKDRAHYAQQPTSMQLGKNRKISGRKKDGSEFIAEITVSPVNINGKSFIASSVRDVTERKEKDEKLLNEEKQFRSTLDNLLELVAILDYDMRYIYVNKAGAEQIKINREELIGYKVSEIFPGFEHTEIYQVYKECIENRTGRHLEIEFDFANGSKGWFEISVQPVPEGILVFSIDRTQKWKAQLKLEEQKTFFESILNNLPADIVVFDRNHRYVFLNPRAVKSDEIREWLVGRDDFDYIALRGLDISIAEKRRERFNSVAADREPVQWVDEYTSPEGTSYVLRKLHPVFDDNGELLFVIGYGIDISESKTGEEKLRQLYSELKHANKELEQFSYMVSHDLQEPLRMVTGFLQLLKLETEDLLSKDAKEYISFATDGAERMKEMIKALLQYSRVGTTNEDFTVVDLDEVVKYVKHVLNEKIEEKHASITTTGLGKVYGIETLLNQLFMNLVSNSLKYNNSSMPQIEIECREEKDHFLFYVKDNGIGIDPKFFDKIFGIFHRLHARNEYAGTGLGLAICKKITEKHGGRIWVESNTGKGATFYFTLLKNI
jgi:PAS domain S-box-containing protein